MNDTEKNGSIISTFEQALLQQVLAYVLAHTDDIIDALLKLIKDKTKQAWTDIGVQGFKADPNADTFGILVRQVAVAGDKTYEDISNAILNEVLFKV